MKRSESVSVVIGLSAHNNPTSKTLSSWFSTKDPDLLYYIQNWLLCSYYEIGTLPLP